MYESHTLVYACQDRPAHFEPSALLDSSIPRNVILIDLGLRKLSHLIVAFADDVDIRYILEIKLAPWI